jgi:hypothetical protein
VGQNPLLYAVVAVVADLGVVLDFVGELPLGRRLILSGVGSLRMRLAVAVTATAARKNFLARARLDASGAVCARVGNVVQ